MPMVAYVRRTVGPIASWRCSQ
ncbi:Protein of unknown function [Gryllus bimaculatus]|nr:Protein of unknown function [Gryllus bimaculatus]